MDVTTNCVSLDVNGSRMSAYIAEPADEGNYPGVIVLMEIFGVNEHIQDVTRRIAREGYVAIAPDYYHRVAPDLALGYNAADIETGKKYKDQVSLADLLADGQAAIDYLRGHEKVSPKGRYGCIGFCFGGYAAYTIATLPEIAATASFYGAGIAQELPGKEEPPADRSDEIRGYMMCFFGEKDASIPQEDIQMIESSLERGRVMHEVIVYPDADHGFFCDQRASYNPEAAFSAWTEVKKQFASQLKGVTV